MLPFSLASAVATAQFAIYKLLKGTSQGFFACQAFLSIIVFVATLLLYLAMLQNRLYFVYIARQLNAIRGYLMDTEAAGFTNNQLYTSTDFSAWKPLSVHTLELTGASLISSLFAGLFVYALYPAFGGTPCTKLAWLTFAIVCIAQIVGGTKYLAGSSKKTADQSIHREN